MILTKFAALKLVRSWLLRGSLSGGWLTLQTLQLVDWWFLFLGLRALVLIKNAP